jgi:hypothetical protein
MDPGLFSPNDPAVNVTPIFEDSNQTDTDLPPDDKLFVHVNFDRESDGPDRTNRDEEGL